MSNFERFDFRLPTSLARRSLGEGGWFMRVAGIYEIHGNLPALEAVLQDIRQADVNQILVGGDVVPGPMPRETIDCLRGLGGPVQVLARISRSRALVGAATEFRTSTVAGKLAADMPRRDSQFRGSAVLSCDA